MSDPESGSELEQFFNKVPEGWGLVPLDGPHTQPQEPPPPDNRTLAARIPSPYQKTNTRVRKQGHATAVIDSRVDAHRRRHIKDPTQLAWDQEIDATYMTKCVCGEKGLAGIIPLAQVMEQLHRTLAGRCGGFARVDSLMTKRALHTCARLLHQGDVEWCIKTMAPIHSLVVRRPGPEAMQEFLGQLIRDLFPSAPDTYIEPSRRVTNTAAGVQARTAAAEQLDRKRLPEAPVLKSPPKIEAIRAMDPDRARALLPHMVDAVRNYKGPDMAAYHEALAALKERSEVIG